VPARATPSLRWVGLKYGGVASDVARVHSMGPLSARQSILPGLSFNSIELLPAGWAALRNHVQERNPNHRSNGPLRVRNGVWFIICGLLLGSVLLITISHHHASPPSSGAELATENPAPQDLSEPRSTSHSIIRAPRPAGASEAGAQPTSSATSVAISNELSNAREKLAKLRGDYGGEHPLMKEQVRAVESLERSALTPGETLELAIARSELARLDVRFGRQHPDLLAQRRLVESLEQSVAAGEASDLAQAKAKLASLRVLYGEAHPEVQSQLGRVAQLQQ
jgi:hypothetical protein